MYSTKVLSVDDQKFQLLFENSPIGISLTHITGELNVNPAFCKMLGYDQGELSLKHWREITHPDDIELSQKFINKLVDGEKEIIKFEKRYLKKNGSELWAEVTSCIQRNEQQKPVFFITMISDMTEKKIHEKEIILHETKYRELFDNNPSPMWFYDVDSLKFLLVNDAAVKNYGYSKEEFYQMTLKDIRPEGDIPLLLENVKIEKRADQVSGPWRHQKKDGTIIFVQIISHKITFNGNNARVVIAHDINSKIIAEKNLQNENAKLNAIIESTKDLIFSVDRNYCYTGFNSNHAAVMKQIYGVEIEKGKCILDYQTEMDRNKAKKNLDKALSGKRVEEISISGDEAISQLYFEIIHNPIIDESGDVIGVSVFARDITESKKAVISLKKREEEFRTLFNEDLTGDFISTENGKLLLCNKKFLDIFGFSSVEQALNTPSEQLYKNIKDRNFLLERIKKDKKIESFELDMLRRDGKVIRILENVIGQFDDKGNLKQLIGYVIDVTEQKTAFQKINQLSRAVEQSPSSIVITDIEGNIQYVNPKGTEITGYSLEELKGQNPRILKSGEQSTDFYETLWNTIKSGKEWRGEFHNKKKNGELYWEYASISPIKNENDEITNFVAVKEDITERKKEQQELIIAKEKAEEMNKVKSSFFSNMSHELRTPLSGILGFTDLLLEEITEPEHKRMLEAVNLSGRRLLDTLNKILHISKIESVRPNMNIELLYIPAIIRDVVNQFEGAIIKKGLHLKMDFQNNSLYSNLDQELLRTILSNLISNAIKFTDKGNVSINCRSEDQGQNRKVIIEISDTGIGIAEKDLAFIFEEFRQASEGLSRLYEGTGLGLTIVKKYTELMDGTITVSSKKDIGSIFTLQFNAAESPDKTQNANENNAENNSVEKNESDKKNKPLVLLVEDDSVNSSLIKKFLLDVCRLHIADNGEDAIELAKNHNYEVILMDIGLGSGMNGLEATQLIRKMPEYEKVPIIAVTAYAMNGEKENFLSSGFSDYISKPFKMGDLVSVLGKALKLI